MEVEGCTHLEPLQCIFRSPSQIEWDTKRNLNLFLLPKKLQLEIEQEISIVRSLLQLPTFVSLLARHVHKRCRPHHMFTRGSVLFLHQKSRRAFGTILSAPRRFNYTPELFFFPPLGDILTLGALLMHAEHSVLENMAAETVNHRAAGTAVTLPIHAIKEIAEHTLGVHSRRITHCKLYFLHFCIFLSTGVELYQCCDFSK